MHNGVVGGVHVGIEWEGTLSVTVVGSIAFWRNDPVLQGTQQKDEYIRVEKKHWKYEFNIFPLQ